MRTWVFDLDNTLYRTPDTLLVEIDQRLCEFVENFLDVGSEEARTIQKQYFREYGLTLKGLMVRHGLDPERYFAWMQETDLTAIRPDPGLVQAIERLEGRKIIYTNAPGTHVETVLARLGMTGMFDGVFDIAEAGFMPKPALEGLNTLIERYGIEPRRALMIDDIARNLEPASALGMTTVWMKTTAEWAKDEFPSDHVDHVTEDLSAWLEEILDPED